MSSIFSIRRLLLMSAMALIPLLCSTLSTNAEELAAKADGYRGVWYMNQAVARRIQI